jgi:hypothetical protein
MAPVESDGVIERPAAPKPVPKIPGAIPMRGDAGFELEDLIALVGGALEVSPPLKGAEVDDRGWNCEDGTKP